MINLVGLTPFRVSFSAKTPARKAWLVPVLLFGSCSWAASWSARSDLLGKVDPVCEAIVVEMNQYAPQCAQGVIEASKLFSSPEWMQIDPRKNIGLLAKLSRYRTQMSTYKDNPPTESQLEQGRAYINEQIDRNLVGLEVSHARIFSYFDATLSQPAGDGFQTLVRVTNRLEASSRFAACPSGKSSGWTRSIYLVTDSMDGPDLRLDVGVSAMLEQGGLFIYRGDYVIANATGITPISLPMHTTAPYCAIDRLSTVK